MFSLDSPSFSAGTAAVARTKSIGWYCLRSQPKHEHLAAMHLRKMEQVQVFLPRVRFRRATRKSLVWVTEALFPCYLFAQFHWQTQIRQVQSAPGVSGVVHFGDQWPTISDEIMAEMRASIGATDLFTISPELSPGDVVQIAGGTLRGLHAVVSRVMPSQERVAVLMELLGQQTLIELAASSLVKEGNERVALFGGEACP